MTCRISRTAIALVTFVGVVVLIFTAAVSLSWRYVHDSPLVIYGGFLISHGTVPYRDLFDMNMPGTYLVMLAMGKVFGWNDGGFRAFDIICLAILAVLTFLWMRRSGKLPAFVAAVAFPLWYLGAGPGISLQREYIALLPFTAMLAIATANTGSRLMTRAFLTGLLSGMTVLVKPNFFILSLPVMLVMIREDTLSTFSWRVTAALLGGLLVPLCATFVYLVASGGIRPFLDIAVNYWPLYTHLTGSHQPIAGMHRLLYIAESTLEGILTIYALVAVYGVVDLSLDRTQKRQACLMGGLLAAAALYPATAGQFWRYHWIPFCYVTLCAASLLARPTPIQKSRAMGIVSYAVVILLLLRLSSVNLGPLYQSLIQHAKEKPPKGGVPDEVAQFLNSHLKPGEAVQPLDWTGGAVHGMLMARAPLATRFMYDFHFYHHIGSPYIARLRREFMGELAAKRPRFIIEVLEDKPWPTGAGTTRSFPELESLLKQKYVTAQTGNAYRILERKDSMPNGQVEAMP